MVHNAFGGKKLNSSSSRAELAVGKNDKTTLNEKVGNNIHPTFTGAL